jgi:anti-sigma-K factor RskA
MKSTQPFDQDDLALYAMQLLPADEAAQITEQLENSPELRRELAAIQSDLALYAHTVDLHSPPALARERLMKQVAREKKIVPIAQPAVREFPVRPSTQLGIDSSYMRQAYAEEHVEETRSFGSKVLPWAGWAIAAGLAVTAGNFYRERNLLRLTVTANAGQLARLTADAAAARQLLDTMNDATALRVTLQKPLTAPIPQGRATYVASKGSLIFLASNMEPLLPYKVYELWIIPADGHDPIPAGTFHPDTRGNASVIMPNLPKGVEAKAFGITIEDEGGATTPTLPIIMAGA